MTLFANAISLYRAARAFNNDGERRDARDRVWAELGAEHKNARQWLGTLSAGCFATHQVYERCDFSCTACYLGKEANATPPLPFEDVKEQIDTIRNHAGPGSNLQITAGEVTLLPKTELARIIRYAKDVAGLDCMVMSHGQTFMKDPSYLRFLVKEGGLEKIAIHVDTTQRGRMGFDKFDGVKEKDLNWIRDDFANLIRDTRKKTGQTLHAAHTFTVTESNIDDVPDVVEWIKNNVDAFRMVSFQPTADVGRTKEREQIQKQDLLWQKIGVGLGIENPNPSTFQMGHQKCNNTSLSWVIQFDEEIHCMEVVRKDQAFDEWFWAELMSGAFRDFYLDGSTTAEATGKLIGLFARSPKYMWQWPYYALRRLADNRSWLPRFVRAVATGKEWRIRPLAIVVHNFMSSHELDTPEGKERLQACGFRVPVKGDMVPMCELNGTHMRAELNRETQERLTHIKGWKPKKKPRAA